MSSRKRNNKGQWISDPEKTIQESINLIESGEYKNRCEPVIRRHVKRYLISKIGHICSICKNCFWNGLPIPLICDHIDGDSTNSDLSNFRLVCANCDAQLDTFKSKNKGKGRKYDRERYWISKPTGGGRCFENS